MSVKLIELGSSELKIRNNKIYAVMSDGTEKLICNIDCEWMVSSAGFSVFLFLMGYDLTVEECAFPRLKYNYVGLPLCDCGDYRSLIIDFNFMGMG